MEIKSIDMVYGAEPRGVPVLLAVTTATALEKKDSHHESHE